MTFDRVIERIHRCDYLATIFTTGLAIVPHTKIGMERGGDDRRPAAMAFPCVSPDCRWISLDGRCSYRVPNHVVARMTGKNRIPIGL
jgi:hypothetical protein